jgi:site-specific recombinase XerD
LQDLSGFLNFIGERLLRNHTDQIGPYISLLGQAICQSIARNISALKTFFRFLVSEGKLKQARLDLETPRAGKGFPVY